MRPWPVVWQLPGVQGDKADASPRMPQGEGLIDRLGDLYRFCPARPRLGKFSQFDQALDQVDTGKNSRQARLPEALVVPLMCEEHHIPLVVVCRLAIVFPVANPCKLSAR